MAKSAYLSRKLLNQLSKDYDIITTSELLDLIERKKIALPHTEELDRAELPKTKGKEAFHVLFSFYPAQGHDAASSPLVTAKKTNLLLFFADSRTPALCGRQLSAVPHQRLHFAHA